MMKKCLFLAAIAALAFYTSCSKQDSDAERNAQVEREVQQRLAAEHQAQEQERLAQQQTDLDVREKALAGKETVATSRIFPNPPSDTNGSERTARGSSRRRPPTRSYGLFYTKLEPYGDWHETANYGYVWQPREAEQSRTWRPYTDGHWVYTDAGWTWISDEPHGWATYHYGRWTRLRNVGWVWVPGDEWAPAWVSWRTSNEYVGWAPLPPDAEFDRNVGIKKWADNYYDIGPEQYAFVTVRELGAPRLERAVLPAEQNVTIVNQTTNVTNITYNNTTVVNEGPSYEEFRSRSQQPIGRYRLERRTEVNVDVPRPVVRGGSIEIAMPALPVAQPAERPRNLKGVIAQAVVDYSSGVAVDRNEVEKARAKMKAEATPPPDVPPKAEVRATAATESSAASTSSAPPPVRRTETSSAAPTPLGVAMPSATASVSATPPLRRLPGVGASVSPTASVSPRPSATRSPEITPSESSTASPASTELPSVSASPSASLTMTASPSSSIYPLATPGARTASSVINSLGERRRPKAEKREWEAQQRAQRRQQNRAFEDLQRAEQLRQREEGQSSPAAGAQRAASLSPGPIILPSTSSTQRSPGRLLQPLPIGILPAHEPTTAPSPNDTANILPAPTLKPSASPAPNTSASVSMAPSVSASSAAEITDKKSRKLNKRLRDAAVPAETAISPVPSATPE
ncbi:MAG: hypothetical protein H0U99_02615 [Chthoniobacterales bacterium]|nr:hypothetical protein [Chthoniobacterales bacterium]